MVGGGAVCVAAATGAGLGAVTGSDDGAGAEVVPMPGGTTSPGFQTGASTVLHVGAPDAGGLVAVAGAGGAMGSNAGISGLGGSDLGSGVGGAGATGDGGLVIPAGGDVS